MRWPFRTVDVLWLAALLSLVALQFWFPPMKGPASDTYNAGSRGKKAFYLLSDAMSRRDAQRSTVPVRQWCQQSSNSTNEQFNTTLLILGPSRYPSESEWKALLTWVDQGGRLVFAARDTQSFDPESADDITIEGERIRVRVGPWNDAPRGGSSEIRTSGISAGFGDATQRWAWKSESQVEIGPGQVIVSDSGIPQVCEYRYGQGRLVVVASDWVFTNQSIAYEDNSVLASRIVAPNGFNRRLVFDESLNRSGTPRVVSLLLEQPLRPATVQLLIVVLMFCWWRSYRFGPKWVPAGSVHSSIVEHTDMVGQLAYNADGGKWALKVYLRQVMSELHLRGPNRDRVLEPVAVRMNRSVGAIKKLLKRARRVADDDMVDRKTAGRLINQLAQVRAAAVEIQGKKPAGGLLSASIAASGESGSTEKRSRDRKSRKARARRGRDRV